MKYIVILENGFGLVVNIYSRALLKQSLKNRIEKNVIDMLRKERKLNHKLLK